MSHTVPSLPELALVDDDDDDDVELVLSAGGPPEDDPAVDSPDPPGAVETPG